MVWSGVGWIFRQYFAPSIAYKHGQFALKLSKKNSKGFYTLCLRKNAPTSASSSFDKHRLILIIFGQQHHHTLKNDVRIQLFLSRHFYLLYLLLNSCEGNNAKRRIFLGRLLVALKRAAFSLADVQSDAILPSCLHVTAFSIDQLLCWWPFVICLQCPWFKSLVTAAGIADRSLYTFPH